jgi:hypothetical protein
MNRIILWGLVLVMGLKLISASRSLSGQQAAAAILPVQSPSENARVAFVPRQADLRNVVGFFLLAALSW